MPAAMWLKTWSGVLGPALDLVGAGLVYYGVRIKLDRAEELERVASVIRIPALGNASDQFNASLSHDRATERVRAGKWAMAGLALFALGFGLQVFAAWPQR